MQRYFVKGNVSETPHSLQFSKDQVHQLKKVMRVRAGEQFEVVDDASQLAIVEVTELEPFEVKVVELLEQKVELPVSVTIAVGLSKGDKLDWIVQKATELGVSEIIPISLTRNVVKWTGDKSAKKIERLQKIAEEASEQSHRLKVPRVTSVMTLKELATYTSDFEQKLIAYEESAKVGESLQLVKSLQSLQENERIIFVFGPEGGIEEQEVELLEQSGYLPCSLGPRILRAETAPLYALAAVSYQCELL